MTPAERNAELKRIVLILGRAGCALLALPPEDRCTCSNRVGRLMVSLSSKLNNLVELETEDGSKTIDVEHPAGGHDAGD